MTPDILDLLTFWYDETHWFPFMESENADITGPGHQDPIAFVQAIRAYDEVATGEHHSSFDVDLVRHRYAVIDPEGETFRLVAQGEPGAVPVTILWGIR